MTEADRIRGYFEETRWGASPGRTMVWDERQALLRAAASHVDKLAENLSICDIGCGDGADLEAWQRFGVSASHLAGTELTPHRAALARERLPEADIRDVEGFELPFAKGVFDICSASLVLSSIRSSDARRTLLREMERVTCDGGVVAVYDFAIRKPWNRQVAAIGARWLPDAWRPADHTYRTARFLPLLDLALRLPPTLSRRVIPMLPRTHRLWVWRIIRGRATNQP